jgi:hypothetical protein
MHVDVHEAGQHHHPAGLDQLRVGALLDLAEGGDPRIADQQITDRVQARRRIEESSSLDEEIAHSPSSSTSGDGISCSQ